MQAGEEYEEKRAALSFKLGDLRSSSSSRTARRPRRLARRDAAAAWRGRSRTQADARSA